EIRTLTFGINIALHQCWVVTSGCEWEMGMRKLLTAMVLAACSFAALVGASLPAAATPSCPATPSCLANGETFTQTGGTSGNGLTFMAFFTTSGQSNAGIAADVLAFLTAKGITGVDYLGRQDGSGLVGGDHITVTNDGGLSGTWTFSPGTTNDIAAYVAI